jgi:hypothetical protein
MSPLVRNLALFGIACGITGSIWWRNWPQIQPPPTVVCAPAPSPAPWTKLKTMDLLHLLESAATDRSRLDAAARVSEIPAANLAEALELATLEKDRKLTFTARVLLIHWAASDGEAACRWAWKRFRSQGLWAYAFREIGPSWAAHHPQALEKWAIAHCPKSRESLNLTLQMAEASNEPILDFSMLDFVSRWLIHEDPHAAYKVLQVRGGFTSNDNLAESLQTVDKVREALSAFDHLDEMVPNHWKGSEIYALSLFAQWKKLDSEDYSRSPYAKLLESQSTVPFIPPDLDSALNQADSLPPAQRQAGIVRAFDAWTKAHPGEHPDTSGWTEVRRRAWEDLDALQP